MSAAVAPPQDLPDRSIVPSTVKTALVPAKKKRKLSEDLALVPGSRRALGKPKPAKTDQPWRLSSSLGGRFLGLDPVFTKDDRHLILAHSNAIKVYSIKTSLLVRSIVVSIDTTQEVISYFLCRQNEDLVYVATPGSISRWNWRTGVCENCWRVQGGLLQSAYACESEETTDKSEGVVYVVARHGKKHSLNRMALRKKEGDSAVFTKTKVVDLETKPVDVKIVGGGAIVVVAVGKEVLVVSRSRKEKERWEEPKRYTMSDDVTCLDVFVTERKDKKEKKQKKKKSGSVAGSIAVGDATGLLVVFHDALSSSKEQAIVTKHHWHRSAVKSVKWALNGNYMISGGLETTLVLWQLDTSHKQFLPHLGAGITHIVVSPPGSSYAVSLTDNSTMILTTSELKPKANIAGIQCASKPAPCLLHPTSPNTLLLVSPSDQNDPGASAPYVQTFDTFADRHISRQALTRTNATIINQTHDKAPIREPSVNFLAISADGQWLASVDSWAHSLLEISLRFWQWTSKTNEWTLVSRVDSPHPGADKILALTSLPQRTGFITLGADGSARVWKPRTRTRAGVAVENMFSWGCRKVITLARSLVPKLSPREIGSVWGAAAVSDDGSTLVAAVPGPCLGVYDDSILHVINADTGTLHRSLSGLLVGRTHCIAVAERYLIVVGTLKVLVFNLVDGVVQWEMPLSALLAGVESAFLATDKKNHRFCVAVSNGTKSVLKIFEPKSSDAIHSETLREPVVALTSGGVGKGFLILDARARIQYLSPVAGQHVSIAATADLEIIDEDEPQQGRMRILRRPEIEAAVETAVEEEMDEDEGVEKVVSREALQGVFDAAGSYAVMDLEACLRKMLGLYAGRPLASDEEDEEESDEDENEEDDEDEDEDDE